MEIDNWTLVRIGFFWCLGALICGVFFGFLSGVASVLWMWISGTGDLPPLAP